MPPDGAGDHVGDRPRKPWGLIISLVVALALTLNATAHSWNRFPRFGVGISLAAATLNAVALVSVWVFAHKKGRGAR